MKIEEIEFVYGKEKFKYLQESNDRIEKIDNDYGNTLNKIYEQYQESEKEAMGEKFSGNGGSRWQPNFLDKGLRGRGGTLSWQVGKGCEKSMVAAGNGPSIANQRLLQYVT